jgi:hypothetical protein
MHLEQAMQSNRDNFASSSPAYWFAGFCVGLTYFGREADKKSPSGRQPP